MSHLCGVVGLMGLDHPMRWGDHSMTAMVVQDQK
jgi:hypothetical protein